MVTEARKMLDSVRENMMLSGGSQARQVDQKSGEKPWGHSQLEIHREVSAASPGWRPGRQLSLRTAGRREKPAEAGWGPGDWTPHRTSVVSCLAPAHPEAPLSPLKRTVPPSGDKPF